MKKKIELLSPAGNADIGIEAIQHGADAVYIGGPKFGARAMAGNDIADIQRLCEYAHMYGAKVYVAMNTLLYDSEIAEAETLVNRIYQAGADALIVQDMAFLQMNLPPIPLHASTQCDIRSVEKAKFLEAAGFEQLVLARELSLEQIQQISSVVGVPIEVFVHGALCVSFSGQCYASEYVFKRSANRGSCAQFCRLPFDLINADGMPLVKGKHLLSLRDMNRSQQLADLIRAGATSFKIEGRLKDVTYVKNVTAYYRRQLDEILSSEEFCNAYVRSSAGCETLSFQPHLAKSFNRGFTDYLLQGERRDLFDFDTPKSKGECLGKVLKIKRGSFVCSERPVAGDGLCFIDADGTLQGFRVNSVNDVEEIFPNEMPHLHIGTILYRNFNHEFSKTLSRPSSTRKLYLDVKLSQTAVGYMLEAVDELGREARIVHNYSHETACTPQRDNMIRQFSKLGGTPYQLREFICDAHNEPFIPSSVLAGLRREIVEKLMQQTIASQATRKSFPRECLSVPGSLTYLANVSNRLASNFYRNCGAKKIEPALEIQVPAEAVLMFCKHCLKFALGCCPRQKSSSSMHLWKEPMSLKLSDGRIFPLQFDCKNCQMLVCAPKVKV